MLFIVYYWVCLCSEMRAKLPFISTAERIWGGGMYSK
jgi:hypothetical protein